MSLPRGLQLVPHLSDCQYRRSDGRRGSRGGWQSVAGELASSVQIVGDDLFTTNVTRIRLGADLAFGERGLN